MVDDVVLNKVATIERCVTRAREEHQAAGESFATDHSRQDAAILNVQRACEAALDLGMHPRIATQTGGRQARFVQHQQRH